MQNRHVTVRLFGLLLAGLAASASAHMGEGKDDQKLVQRKAEVEKIMKLVTAKVEASRNNLKVATACLARAKPAADAGDAEKALADCECVRKMTAETERLVGDLRVLGHITHVHVGADANGPVKPALDAADELRKLNFEAAIVAEKAIAKSNMNRDELYAKVTSESMKADLERHIAALRNALADAEKFAAALQKAAAAWEDVDEKYRASLAKVVGEFAPNLKAAFKLFDKLVKVAIAAIDPTVDGSDQHFITLKKEGTTAEKFAEILANEAGGEIAKFTDDLDELGVPTMKKAFKDAKIKLETVARDGERLLSAAIAVLKPGLRKQVKEKSLASYRKLIGTAKAKLVAVITEIKSISVKLGSESGGETNAE